MCWDPTGSYLLSVSDDQTARLYLPCKPGADGSPAAWHEVARPQVHGYDMRCCIFTAPHVLVTGADEKVIRVFEAPANFFETASALADVDDAVMASICKAGMASDSRPLGASIPALGLSNKAVFEVPAGKDAHAEGVDGTTRTAFSSDGAVRVFRQKVALEDAIKVSRLCSA
jgi:elongator complex protein 2